MCSYTLSTDGGQKIQMTLAKGAYIYIEPDRTIRREHFVEVSKCTTHECVCQIVVY